MSILQHQVLVCHFVKGGQSPLHGMCKIPGWHFVEDSRGFVQEAALRISTHGIYIIKKASGFLRALALGVGEEQRFDDKIMLWHLIEEEELQVFQETAVDVAGEDCSLLISKIAAYNELNTSMQLTSKEIVMNALTQIRSGQFTRLERRALLFQGIKAIFEVIIEWLCGGERIKSNLPIGEGWKCFPIAVRAGKPLEALASVRDLSGRTSRSCCCQPQGVGACL
ncbi:hypothetical protein SELMODRAFT_402352 [Selaginella moellendorffii]|uniref:Uncharacterized protein n=1 Tax=Selaginella moellendorffii TaxID=88036 RepID=D8QQD1_SELML|nr:hypothetical protein SELMODRAFT_402352 [Selaginella moellendorffii]